MRYASGATVAFTLVLALITISEPLRADRPSADSKPTCSITVYTAAERELRKARRKSKSITEASKVIKDCSDPDDKSLDQFCRLKVSLAKALEKEGRFTQCASLLEGEAKPGFGPAAPQCLPTTDDGKLISLQEKEIQNVWARCDRMVNERLKPKLLARLPKTAKQHSVSLSPSCTLKLTDPIVEVPASGNVEDFVVPDELQYSRAELVKDGKTVSRIESEVLDPFNDSDGLGFSSDRGTYTLLGGSWGASNFNEERHRFDTSRCIEHRERDR